MTGFSPYSDKSLARLHGRRFDETSRVPMCRCGQLGVRSERWDAYYCPTSRVWLEAPCCPASSLWDTPCRYCDGRPEDASAERAL